MFPTKDINEVTLSIDLGYEQEEFGTLIESTQDVF